MAKTKSTPKQTSSESNMTASLTQAAGTVAELEAPTIATGSPVVSAPPVRKQNGQFTQDQETRRQAAAAKAKAARDEADARADATLDKLFGADPDEKPTKAKDQAESAQDQAQPAEKPEAKDETSVQQTKPSEATEQALDKALAVLRLDGWATEDLKELSTERIVVLAAKASKRQADYSNKIRELSEKAEAASTIATDEPEPASQPAFDPSAAIKAATEILGEDTAPALTKLVGEVTGHAEKLVKAQADTIASMSSQLTFLIVSEARRGLEATWPEIADQGRFATDVLPKTAQLWNKGNGGYESIADAMYDAARLKLGDPITERKDATEFRRKREAGQPRSETNATKPPKAKSIGDYQDDVLDRLFAGDIEGAQKVARG